MTIASPKTANDYPDRPLECQFAIEPVFQDLARQAHAAGWSDSEVAAALIDLAHNHMRVMIADRGMQQAIDEAKQASGADGTTPRPDAFRPTEADF